MISLSFPAFLSARKPNISPVTKTALYAEFSYSVMYRSPSSVTRLDCNCAAYLARIPVPLLFRFFASAKSLSFWGVAGMSNDTVLSHFMLSNANRAFSFLNDGANPSANSTKPPFVIL